MGACSMAHSAEMASCVKAAPKMDAGRPAPDPRRRAPLREVAAPGPLRPSALAIKGRAALGGVPPTGDVVSLRMPTPLPTHRPGLGAGGGPGFSRLKTLEALDFVCPPSAAGPAAGAASTILGTRGRSS